MVGTPRRKPTPCSDYFSKRPNEGSREPFGKEGLGRGLLLAGDQAQAELFNS